jgi:RNA polymerase sigma-70 factor, ECF subfamily
VDADVSDEYLVVRAREGHLDAFELLVQRHSARTYRIALRLLDDPHQAQVVAGDVFLSAWRDLAAFPADSSFTTWLYAILIRQALAERDVAYPAGDVESSAERRPLGDGPTRSTRRPRSADDVSAAVVALPAAQRVAVVLHHFEGLSYSEVAAILACTVPAVRTHLFRARRTLAGTLGRVEVRSQ